MNTLINHLIDDVKNESAHLKKSTLLYVNKQINYADQLKSKVHNLLSRSNVRRWIFILTVLIANFLVEI